MIKRAVYPGTFDPITLGHLDIIKASSLIFDEVVVGLLVNLKKKPMFSESKRKEMIELVLEKNGITNVLVKSFYGLAVEFVVQEKAVVLIRGLRLTTEYESELNISFNNYQLDEMVTTILIPPMQKHVHISSSAVRELIAFKSNKLDKYLPAEVITLLD
ncbi:pantetheine-phosphate adenylyltransferase [Patescibacteria group bacterium]